MQVSFTERYLNSIASPIDKDRWETDARSAAGLSLQLRIRPNGAKIWYVRQRRQGADIKRPLGVYLKAGDPGHMSLADARDAAYKVSLEVLDGKVHQPSTAPIVEATAPLVTAAAPASGRCTMTVADVADAYYRTLLDGGKRKSAGQVRSAFKLGIAELFPHIAAMNAALLTPEEATDVIRRGMELGRSKYAADKLRSVMQSAYTVAIGASINPNVPKVDRPSGILLNPFSSVVAVKEAKNAKTRVLSDHELRAFMLELGRRAPLVAVIAILLVIRLGGQRLRQLLRVEFERVSRTLSDITLFDSKGKRRIPRPHLVPMVPQCIPLLNRQLEIAKTLDCKWVFTAAGKTSLDPQTVIDEVKLIRDKLLKEDSAVRYFTLADIRRTVETFLASKRVPKIVRGHLQSHGLSGVQHTHYDMWEYIDEKREALEMWNAHLDSLIAGDDENVTSDVPSDSARWIPDTINVDRELFEALVLPHLSAGSRHGSQH